MLSMLVVCTLGYSSAWAFDDHTVDEIPHVGDIYVLLDDNPEQMNDHCGHIFAHLVGLFAELNFAFKKTSFDVYSESSSGFISFIPAIYLRPPNV